MGSLSIWHWLIVLLFFIFPIVPAWKIVAKAGHSGAWALLCFVPVINVIAIWVFAFKRWPALSK
jgi:uncharacterized membrane protein YhaH (DUF805 family)